MIFDHQVSKQIVFTQKDIVFNSWLRSCLSYPFKIQRQRPSSDKQPTS